jgi:hypothetical protein
MYVHINRALDLPFTENKMKSIAAGVITNTARNLGAFVILSSVAKIIPGLGTVGGTVVQGVTMYGCTVASGIIYMKALSKLIDSRAEQELRIDELSSAIDEVMRDKATIGAIIKDAKKAYRKSA